VLLGLYSYHRRDHQRFPPLRHHIRADVCCLHTDLGLRPFQLEEEAVQDLRATGPGALRNSEVQCQDCQLLQRSHRIQ
jgi:hypothetical protein